MYFSPQDKMCALVVEMPWWRDGGFSFDMVSRLMIAITNDQHLQTVAKI
jgi:hypothetical protein